MDNAQVTQRPLRLLPGPVFAPPDDGEHRVAGADFDADLAVSVLRMDTLALVDPWSELEQAHVLRDGVFAHDLLREATLRGLPAALTRRLHGEVAAHLAGRDAAPASVARHWLAAGERTRAAPAAAAAARQAAAAMLVDAAAHWFTTAARLEEEAKRSAEACALWLELAQFAESVSAGPLQDRASAEAERLAASGLQKARAALHRATLLTRDGDYEATIAICRTAMQGLARDDDPILFGMLDDELVGAMLWLDRRDEALALVADSERYWRGLADSPAADDFYCNLGVTLNMLDRREEAAAAHRQSIALSRRHGRAANTLTALGNLGVNRGDAGRPLEAIEAYEEAERLWLSLPDVQGISRANLDANLAFALLAVGRYGEALARIDRALESAEAGQAGFVASYLVTQATLWLHLGQFARALRSADSALQRATSAPVFKGRAHLLKGLVARGRGQSPQSNFDAASALLDGRGKYLASGQLALARCADMPGDAALAAALGVRREAERKQLAGLVIGADAQLARCALALGRTAEAAVHARAVLDGLEPWYPDVLTALPAAWLAAGQALLAAGDAQGRAVLETAAQWLRLTARDQVPEPFRESFLERNPVHRALLAQAGLSPDAGATPSSTAH